MSIPEKTPKVSVCVITYNQEKYIRQCLQSIVDQETDFDFEIIVGEDCSTDGTKAIVQEFAERYPEVVKPIYQSKNIDGGVHNFLSVHAAATGEYIAHVDGDDYCLPGKLQSQVKVLDGDINCNIVFHRMLEMQISGVLNEGPYFENSDICSYRFDRSALLRFVAVGAHSSKMYRKSLRSYPLPNFAVTDYFTNVEQVGQGYARFVGSESLGVYRVGVGIAYSGYGVRKALAETFLYFCKKYPQYRLQINTAALTYFLANSNNSKAWPMFLDVWIRTFHPLSIFNIFFRMRHLRLNKKNHV
jgi:glycosyltransferase involved in cell wall biosynthesis